MIRCIIVEDEALARDVIMRHLRSFDQFELTGTFRNAPDAIEALRKQPADLMFLDIRLPGMSGLDLLASLSDPPLVILTTAYAEYALESYEFNVIDYLLKPISFERFSRAIEKLSNDRFIHGPGRETEKAAVDHIFIKSGSRYYKVNFQEILYVQGMKDYLKIHTAESVLITHQTLSELETILPPRDFLRIHKSYIVAIPHIRSVFGNSIDIGKVILPVGINYKEKVSRLIAGQG